MAIANYPLFHTEISGCKIDCDQMSLPQTSNSRSSVQEIYQDLPKSKSNVLCHLVSKNFNKTPRGKILESDIKDIYSLMLIGLNLKEAPPKKFDPFSKSHSYCFSAKEALGCLARLEYEIPTKSVTINFSYEINQESSIAFLHKFFEAKLLHYPNDRTRNQIYLGTMSLQPTPKGIAILSSFLEKYGVKWKNLPKVVNSSLNSMKLFSLERNLSGDKIVYSNSMVLVLFVAMLGPAPVVWRVDNKPEEIGDLVKSNISIFLTQADSPSVNQQAFKNFSPLHHTYFTNPASDSHVQYYSSQNGLRVFRDQTFGNTKFRYSFSGKSIAQWLMDCTDILSPKQATEIGNLFLKLDLLTQVMQSAACTSSMFIPSDEAFYILTPYSKTITNWFSSRIKKFEIHSSSGPFRSFGLDHFLKDPGLTIIFQTHLEAEYCSENLRAYLQLKLFSRKLALLNKLIDYCESRQLPQSSEKMKKLTNECLSLAYYIYFTYLSSDAAYGVNIVYDLRERIDAIMIEDKEALNYFESTVNSPVVVDKFDGIPSASSGDSGFSECGSISESSNGQNITPCSSFKPPLESTVYQALQTLTKFAPLVKETLNALHKLMEVDSFPKFLESETLQNYRRLLES